MSARRRTETNPFALFAMANLIVFFALTMSDGWSWSAWPMGIWALLWTVLAIRWHFVHAMRTLRKITEEHVDWQQTRLNEIRQPVIPTQKSKRSNDEDDQMLYDWLDQWE